MFQLYASIYALILSINSKEILLFYNYKFVSRLSFTSAFVRIIISLTSWQLSLLAQILTS